MFNLKASPIICSSLHIIGTLLIAASLFLPVYICVTVGVIGFAMVVTGFLPLKNHCRKISKGLV